MAVLRRDAEASKPLTSRSIDRDCLSHAMTDSRERLKAACQLIRWSMSEQPPWIEVVEMSEHEITAQGVCRMFPNTRRPRILGMQKSKFVFVHLSQERIIILLYMLCDLKVVPKASGLFLP